MGNLKNLRFSLWDAFFFCVMIGAGENYLSAFALSEGMSESLAGLFSTVPLGAGALLHLITPWGLNKVGSIKTWVVGSVVLQALTLVPLIFWHDLHAPHWLLFIIASFYWGAGFAASPVWNRWMVDLVPAELSIDFFARRLRVCQYGILVGLIIGGVLLHNKAQFSLFTSVFSSLFLVAFVSRASSGIFLSMQEESKMTRNLSIFEMLKQVRNNPESKKLLTYFGIFWVVVSISSPYVNPFLLKKLELTPEWFTRTLVALFIGKIIGYAITQRFLKDKSPFTILVWGAWGISPWPAVWTLIDSPYQVFGLQMVSGVFWGIFDTAMTLVVFKEISTEKKISWITIYNIVQCTGIFIGSAAGGLILKSYGESLLGYQVIFVVSTSLRFFGARVLQKFTQQILSQT